MTQDERLQIKVLGAKEDLEINKKNMHVLQDTYKAVAQDNMKKEAVILQKEKREQNLMYELELLNQDLVE